MRNCGSLWPYIHRHWFGFDWNVALRSLSQFAYAIPRPNPVPNITGHGLLLKNRTENVAPISRPPPNFNTESVRHLSHFLPTSSSENTGVDILWLQLQSSPDNHKSMVLHPRYTHIFIYGMRWNFGKFVSHFTCRKNDTHTIPWSFFSSRRSQRARQTPGLSVTIK